MPFALVVIGLLMIVTGARDTYEDFGGRIVGEFTGSNNFTYWIASIGAVGALGYIKQLETFSRVFMSLIILVIFLTNGGFFSKFTQSLQQGPIAPQKPTDTGTTATPAQGAAGPSISTGNSIGDNLNSLNQWLGDQFNQGRQQVTSGIGHAAAAQNFTTFLKGLTSIFGF
ncbi:MAG: hypothetical protein KGL39_36560 [Patescibacteria group bacterium]|nr:hypothetical protein [Patescibacteria group bacterium]